MRHASSVMRITLAVLSAVLLILSFPPFDVWILAYIAFVPLLFAVQNSGIKRSFLTSFFAGFIFFLGTMWWLVHVTLPGMVIVVAYLALYFGLFGVIVNNLLRYTMNDKRWTTYMPLVLIPAAWVAAEWLRAHVFTGFGWNLLGYSQSFNLPAAQIADMTGAYGVSFFIIAVNTAVYAALSSAADSESAIVPLMAACVVVFAVYGYGVYRLNNVFTGERVRVSVAQANIPQKDKWDPDFAGFIMDKYAALTKECAEKKPDLVIWPETSVPGFLEADKDLSDRVSSLAKDAGANLLVGAPRHEAGNGRASYYNSSYLYLKDGSSAGRYDKVHLVPFGEYLPFERLLSFVERFSRRPIGDFTAGADYTVFGFFVSRASAVKNVRMRTMKRVPFSCLICFEDIFPELARRFVAGGALFLANMTNDAWFGRSGAPYEHAQASVFRAIENRVNVVRAANTGVSCFIDQKGDITARAGSPGADIFVEGTVTREIVLSKTRTLYNTYGDVFAYICAALALCGIVLRPKAA